MRDIPTAIAAEIMAGDDHLRSGRPAAAIDAYARALTQSPDLPDVWFNRAWAERAERRFDDALASYGEALARGLDAPEAAHLNRATILSEQLQRTNAAIAELEAALTINPTFVEAWLNLGNLREDQGDAAAARLAYEAALRCAPGNGRAQARLAALAQHEGRARAAAAALKAALPAAADAADRAEMLFALGNALDADGDYADAAQAIEAANWIARQLAPTRYDAAAQDRFVDALIRLVPAPLPAARVIPGPRPIFVCGMFRSGSTLAERLLGRHPAIRPAGELDTIPAFVARDLAPYPQSLAQLDTERATALRRDYQDLVARLLPDVATITDKRPDNVFHIGLIKAMFPEARIIHTVRAPLDNLLSIHFLQFGEGVGYGHDLRDAAHHYIGYRRLMAHWRHLFADDIIDLDYDALVAAPEATLRPALAALGLPWDDACLRTHSEDAAVRTASVWQVRQPLHTRSSGRARHYATMLAPARALLQAAGLL